MHTDIENRYRALLEHDPPSFLDRVNTPWDDVPDLPAYNRHAFNRIERALRALTRTEWGRAGSNAQGILVLGEAGTGKTHLLMRVARRLSESNHVLFIRKPNTEEAVAQHIWTEMVSSLAQPFSGCGTERSQLDDLLVRVFSAVLIEWRRSAQDGKDSDARQRWTSRLEEDPYSLLALLGEGDRRQEMLAKIRRWILRSLQVKCPYVDQAIAHVLVTYCLVRREDRKRVLRAWLSFQDVDSAEAADLGLATSWVAVDEHSSDVSTQQQREEQALRAIRTIGILSTYYQPLILAFDQLEGLRDHERLTAQWGDVVREIFTMTPNCLVVTCVFPSLWNDWFGKRLDRSAVERIAQQTVTLDTFSAAHGLQMLATHLKACQEKHRLPTSIYPFADEDVAELCQRATSPRSFLQGSRAAFEAWLDADTPVGPMALEHEAANSVVSQRDVDRAIRHALTDAENRQRCSFDQEAMVEQDFLGRIRNITEAVLGPLRASFELAKASHRHYVMPPNFVVRDTQTGAAACVAIVNAEGSAFFPRMRNLNSWAEKAGQFAGLVLLRDRRCRPLGPRSQELLQDAKKRGAVLVEAGVDEIVTLHAVYETLVAVEEHDLSVGQHVIHIRQLIEFLKAERLLGRTELYRQVAKASPIIARAIGADAPAESATDHVALVCGNGAPLPDRLSPSGSIDSGRVDASRGIRQPKVDVVIGDDSFDTPHVGILGDLRDDHRRLAISLTKPQGLLILGYMGSGKSYALGVLIENALMTQAGLISQSRPMAVVAFNYRKNPHARFEYGGFAVPNDRQKEVAALAARYGASPAAVNTVNVFGYEPEIARRAKEYGGLRTRSIRFRSDELGAEHWEILMKPPRKEAEYMDIIRDIIQKLHYQERLTFHNLQRHIEADERLSSAQQRRAKNRLSFAERWISDERPCEWADVLTEGTLNIFDLRMQAADSSDALRLCLIITDLVRRTKNGVNKMVVFDEAHEYVDCKQLVGELENALTQIRHDGLSFVLASQFPERIPKEIFRYLLTRMIFKLPTAEAINYLRNSAPNLQGLSPKKLANLDLEHGICFVQTDDDCTDPSLRVPQPLEVRPRCSLHGGATVRQMAIPTTGLDLPRPNLVPQQAS